MSNVLDYVRLSELFEVVGSDLVRKVTTGSRGVKGTKVGSDVKGYLRFEVRGVTMSVHAAIWMIHNQMNIPDGHVVDHKDLDYTNNHPSNLRLASRGQNCYNVGLYKNNTSGYKGVSFDSTKGVWIAQIRVDGKNRNLGSFSTAESANDFLVDERARLHGRFANNG